MVKCAAIQACDGVIYSGHRHADIIKDMVATGKYSRPVTKGAIQGFLDDKGNFLTREEARDHFLSCGQVSVAEEMHPTMLFSEDLY